MLFRNYCGVLVFVTFRIGIVIVGGNLQTFAPTIAMIVTLLAAEILIYLFPTAFENKPPSANAANDTDWEIDNGDDEEDEFVGSSKSNSSSDSTEDNTAV